MNAVPEIRPSPIAGRWYEGDPLRLAKSIDLYLSEVALPPLEGELLAIVAPHAGHRYSGRTAAYSFQAAAGKHYELVIVASPYHSYHPAALLTSAHLKYATPLGEIAIDEAAVQQLGQHLQEKGYSLQPVAYDEEHSLEIELPFLQRVLPDNFKLLPVMVRSHDWQTLRVLADALAEIARHKSTLLVASSDLSHFYPERSAKVLDREMLNRIASLKPESVLSAEAEGAGFACGAGAVAAIISAAVVLGGNTAIILNHSTSGDETGDLSSVVGYGSVAIMKKD